LLADHEQAASETGQMAATINRESVRLTRLVENALDVARLQAGRMPCAPRPLALAPLLREAAAVLDGARRSHRVAVCAADDLPLAWADPDRLRQVLDNLLDNAMKYSPPGSRIAISAALGHPLNGEVGASGDAGLIEVRVEDEGPGIPPSQLEHVFERFTRLAETPGGAGLGLHLCRGLVELMGGAITAEPARGGGACVRFTLPLAAAGAVAP
jgi:two-component system sensor histidine kinase KdpD